MGIIPAHKRKRWYLSGAIAQPVFPQGTLTIEAMGHTMSGYGAGFTTLSLGIVPINKNASTCLYYAVVPTDEKHKLGNVLQKLPGNAVPCDIFYGKS
jgi:hypothetical protein